MAIPNIEIEKNRQSRIVHRAQSPASSMSTSQCTATHGKSVKFAPRRCEPLANQSSPKAKGESTGISVVPAWTWVVSTPVAIAYSELYALVGVDRLASSGLTATSVVFESVAFFVIALLAFAWLPRRLANLTGHFSKTGWSPNEVKIKLSCFVIWAIIQLIIAPIAIG